MCSGVYSQGKVGAYPFGSFEAARRGVVGGMAAQEAIKLITSQFVPLTGGLLYVETAPG